MIELLIRLGLSEKEAAVYLAALELGEDTVQHIAEKSKVNRATTYVILEKLMSLGLASSVERGKKTVFVAEDPHELGNLFEAQLREVEERKRLLKQSMTQLQAIHNTSTDKPIVRFFEGADGLEALDRYGHADVARTQEYLSIFPADILEKRFPARRKAAVQERVAAGLRSRVIYTHEDGAVLNEEVNKDQLREAKFIPRERLPIDVTITIYPGWGVKFFNFDEGNLFGVLIQSPNIARNMKEVFELAWQSA